MESDDERRMELEERLYAQIHHNDSPGNSSGRPSSASNAASTSDLLLNISGEEKTPERRKSLSNRYWTGEKPAVDRRPPYKPNHNRPPPVKSTKILGLGDSPSAAVEKPVETQPFKSYTSIFQSMGIRTSFNTNPVDNKPAGGNKNFRKPQNVAKNNQGKNKNQQSVLRFQQYFAKAEKANNVRKNLKNKRPVETICLESSSDENDDVIEIPVPPPPLVLIDSSDESTVVSKPDGGKKTKGVRTSRCSSPSSSIVSDDFIAQNDKSRLLSASVESLNVAADEDLRLVNRTVDSVRKKKKASEASPKQSKGRVPLLYKDLITRQKEVQIQVVTENIPEEDAVVIISQESVPKSSEVEKVVEEESVYMKGKKRRKSIQKPQSSSDSESSDDLSAANSKTSSSSKKKKKKKSKPTTPISSSGESEPEGVPYIRSGEAVSNAKTATPKKRKPIKKRLKQNSGTNSDNEFISMISSIAQGQDIEDSDSVEVVSEPEQTVIEVPDEGHNESSPDESEEVSKEPVDDTQVSINVAAKDDMVDEDENDPDEVQDLYKDYTGLPPLKVVPIRAKPRDEWQISDRDRQVYPRLPRVKCHNCQEIGHVRARCKAPMKPVCCYMCGMQGHREPRCPYTICLMCGTECRVFSIRCRKCHFMENMRCRNCNGIGHIDKMCPEKWRRYHSTVEDDGIVHQGQFFNNRIRCCSVCARRGHRVENCQYAGSFLEYRPTSTDVLHYTPIYPNLYRNRQWVNNDNLMVPPLPRRTFDNTVPLPDFRMNEIAVPPFRKESVAAPPKIDSAPKSVDTKKDDSEIKITIGQQSDERMVSSTTTTTACVLVEEGKPKVEQRRSPVDSDSNYSFTDFFDKDSQEKVAVAAAKDKDFLSLSGGENLVSSSKKSGGEEEKEESTSAKIFLSKPHAVLLLTEEGNNFLIKKSQAYGLEVRLEWQAITNLLVVNGRSEDQTKFHSSLVQYLKNHMPTEKEHNKFCVIPPKGRFELVQFIEQKLGVLETNLGNVFASYQKMLYAEKFPDDPSLVVKKERARITLNMILMGQAGLRKGAYHLTGLKQNLVKLNNLPADCVKVPGEIRCEIDTHFKYIFTAMKHQGYPQLIRMYKLQNPKHAPKITSPS